MRIQAYRSSYYPRT